MLSNCQVVDLSHELHEGVPTWTGSCGFGVSVDFDYEEVGCRVMSYRSEAGVGTHMDAPSHFVPGGAGISDLPVENFVAPLCVIRVSTGEASDYLLSVGDVTRFEEEYGTIPEGSLVVADTGWARHWRDPRCYRNVDASGVMHFPGFHIDAVALLLERGIVGVGIDTLSPDGGSAEFPVHHLLLPRRKYIIENLTNLEAVPEAGAWVVALPPKVHGGAEAPCRCIALVSPRREGG